MQRNMCRDPAKRLDVEGEFTANHRIKTAAGGHTTQAGCPRRIIAKAPD
jgi:hypothetical protein